MSWGEKLAFIVLAPVLTPFAIASVLYDEFSDSSEESKDFSSKNEDIIKNSQEELQKDIALYKKKAKKRLENKYNFKINFQNEKIIITEDNLQIQKNIKHLINKTKELKQIIQELEKENYFIWSQRL